MPWNKLCGGDTPSRKVNLIVNGVLQAGVAFANVINNFGGSTQGNYYRFTRTSGSGTAIGRSAVQFDFSNGKKLYIEGYTTSASYNGAATNVSNSVTNVDNLANRQGLLTSEAVIEITPASDNEYIYLYALSSSYYGYIKNMWIE